MKTAAQRFGLAILLCSLSVLRAWAEPLAPDRPLFRFNGLDYLESDLSPGLRQSLYELEHAHFQKQQAIVDAALFDMYLEHEAERSGRTKELTVQALLAVNDPGEKEVREFFESNKEQIPYPYDQAKRQIERFLRTQQMQAKRQALVAKLKAQSDFEMLLTEPVPPVVEIASNGFPSKGNPNAKVTVVEFADYQCPHCKSASLALTRLLKVRRGEVRWVYMDYPINRSGISRTVAEGAVCADKQGKFWPYHDLAFERQNQLNQRSPIAFAKALGLDMDAFSRCLDSPEAKAKVKRSEKEARRLGLSSTPSLFVNGRRLHVEDMDRDIGSAVERALEKTPS